MRRFVRLMSLWLLLFAAPATAQESLASCDGDSTARQGYCVLHINGWSVRYAATLIARSEVAQSFDDRLRKRLAMIAATLPEARVKELRRVPIWADDKIVSSAAESQHPSVSSWMYHPSRARWLGLNGYPEFLTGGIFIGNVATLLRAPADGKVSMVLHELAHAYHDQVLGVQRQEILDAFRNATETGLYRDVKTYSGRTAEKAYALTNAREYFAELTEAFYSANEIYPFTRDELRGYDPVGFEAVRKAWEEQPSQPEYVLSRGSGCTASASRSVKASSRAQFSLRNESAEPVQVYWIGYDGERKAQGEVPAGAFYKMQNSYKAHSWLLSDVNNDCLAIFTLKDDTAFVRLGP